MMTVQLPKVGERWHSRGGIRRSTERGHEFVGEVNPHNRYITINLVRVGDRLGREVQGTLDSGEDFSAPLTDFMEKWNRID